MFVRFLENGLFRVLRDEAGDSNQGGGGGETPAPKMVPQDQVNALLAKERRTWQAKLAEYEERFKGFDEIKAELEKVKEEREMAGKSAAEKLEARHAKDLKLLQEKLDLVTKSLSERDAAVKQSETTLFEERLGNRLSAELGKAKVMPQYLEKAAKLARLELQDVKFEDGKWTASFGDHIDKPIADVIAAWAKENDNFLPAASGGAGTRTPNGGASVPKNLWDMESPDLLALDAKQRAGR